MSRRSRARAPLRPAGAALAVLPWLPARARLPRFSYRGAAAAGPLCPTAIGLALRAAGQPRDRRGRRRARGALSRTDPATRVGEGAEIVVVLDRSRSMDQPFGEPSGMHWSDARRESKGQAARRLLGEVRAPALGRRVRLPDLQRATGAWCSISAARPRRSRRRSTPRTWAADLGETDIARALEAATELFEPRPYLGGRVVLLVSDGGAQIDEQMRVRS